MNRKKINIVITILTVNFIFISSLACIEGVLSKNQKLNQLTSWVVDAMTDYQISQIDYSAIEYHGDLHLVESQWGYYNNVTEDEFYKIVQAQDDDYDSRLLDALKAYNFDNVYDAFVVGTRDDEYTISADSGEIKKRIFSLSDIQDIRNSAGEQTSQNASPSEDTIKSGTENVPKGSITLTGNIEAPSIYTVSQLTLTINFDTGEITTGSFTGSYYYPGEVIDLGALGKIVYEPDTANGVANFGGNVNLKTGKITGAGAVVYTWASGGAGETWAFKVEGDLSTTDYKSASGKFIFSEQGEWTWEASD